MTTLLVPKGQLLIPGKLYLHLFHGRRDPGQPMQHWGFSGPTFGPLQSVNQTYGANFRFSGEKSHDEIWLAQHEDLIVWESCYYGDVAIIIATEGNVA